MDCKPRRELAPNRTYGIPDPRYIRPLVRINGMIQDMPFGYKFNPCWLPMDAIAEATNQTLSYNPVTRTISLSGGGGSVAFPVQVLSYNQTTQSIELSSGGGSVQLTTIISNLAKNNPALFEPVKGNDGTTILFYAFKAI